MRNRGQLEVGRRTLELSNLDKVLYPKTGFTKGAVIDYYIQVAPWLLPHLRNRPITLKRYPDGVEGFFFYERNCPSHRPTWMKTARARKANGTIDYCVINELPALVWAANLANLELHTFLHRTTAVDKPTAIAFDLDPGEPAGLRECCAVALKLRAYLKRLQLKSYPKTSGAKGIQVYVPLNTPALYHHTKAFAHQVAEHLERQNPDLVVSRMIKKLRRGKVLIDWSQNDAHKTTVNVYSLRAKESPTVSTPVLWPEVAAAARTDKGVSLVFHWKDALSRVKKMGDLFLPVLVLKQTLPPIDGEE